MCSKAIDLRETLRAVLAHRAAQVPDRERPPPLVHTDECLDHPKVKETVAYLCGVGLAAGCDSLWLTKRVRPNGEPFYVWGGYKALRAIESFRGLPAKYFSWSDEQVLHVLLGKFLGSDHLVLLTANSRLGQRGLRKLLLEEIRPELINGHRVASASTF